MPRPSWVSAASLLAAAVALGACSSDSGEVAGEATLRVYVSLPLSGPNAPDGRDAADGAELALADAGATVAGLAVDAVVLDDTEGADARARWTPAQAAANARAAIQDSTAIAYLGDFESGATRASLPWTNEARMLQVSPASSAVDLVTPFPGSEQVPDAQPSGERSFGRVIPSDDAQGRAGASWARELGAKSVGVLSAGTRFADTLATSFAGEAQALGLERLDATRASLRYLAGEPGYFLGLDIDPVLVSTGVQRQIGSDAFLEPGFAVELARYRGPYLITSAALDPTQLPSAGRRFVADFEREYGRTPGRYAAYGYEAMAVILDSIDRASEPTDRPAVVAAFFETADRESVLGRYSVDELGDTTLNRLTGYELSGAAAEPVAELRLSR